METKQEERLLAACRLMPQDELEILLDFAEARARKNVPVKPHLRLLVRSPAPAQDPTLGSGSGQVKDHVPPLGGRLLIKRK